MQCSSCSTSRSQATASIATERSAVVGIFGPETVELRIGALGVGVCGLELDAAPDVPLSLGLYKCIHSLSMKLTSGLSHLRFRLSLSSAMSASWSAQIGYVSLLELGNLRVMFVSPWANCLLV